MKPKVITSNEKYFAELRYEGLKEDKYFEKEKVVSGFCRPLEVIKTVLEFPIIQKSS